MKTQIAALGALALLAACTAAPNPNVTISTTPSSREDTEPAVGIQSAGGRVAAPSSASGSSNLTTSVAVGKDGLAVGANSKGEARVGTTAGARNTWWLW